ncbi:uncharacterized protein LOC133297702 [Gastrolobium bilobum]|uniref:uncharacterized protein LOC133297702 n=1 Tax=Gastrolobium bilobum TaxID=150636 RepID=UPI002AB30200|nr:uncharacterized protein LOC133297702 [Gastrolobium bilobum]
MKSLTEIWNAQLPSDSFGKLDTLIIEQCDRLNNVFPSNVEGKIFRSLCNLRVTNCRSMEEIFDQDAEKVDAKDVNNLQDVHLEALPKLQHVWKRNKDQRVLNLKKLQKIRVQHCHKLEYIFPIFEAKCLEYLVACDCFELRDIVVKGNGNSANTSNSNPPFVFPKLTTIKFSKLPRLRSFYSGDYELRCEVLSDLSIELCDKFEPFKNETQRRRVLFPEKVINNLKAMQIESWHAKSSSSYMSEGNHRWDNLEELHLSRLMNTDVLYSFLHRNPNLKSLSLSNCFFKEMVPCRKPPQIKNLGVVPKLKSLKLIDLPNLEEIGFQQDKVLQRIEFLILKKCPSLITIMHFSVSLAHLTYLEVVDCKGLQYLMTPSSAESLTQLSTMKVLKCESLKEIVSKQGNEGENAGKVYIVFRQLKTLELVSLKSLESFCCSNSCIFEFPVLEKLVVSACPKMKKFSEVAINTPILQKIYVAHEQEKRWCWDGNLRDTIQKMFNEKRFLEGMKEISFAEKAWHDGVGVQNNSQIESSGLLEGSELTLFPRYTLKDLRPNNCQVEPSGLLEGSELTFSSGYSLKDLRPNNCQVEPSGLLKGIDGMRLLDQMWHDGVCLQSNWFYSLKTLKLNNCQIEPYAIPSNLPYLKSLKEFEVRDCYRVKAIFDMNNTEIMRIASQLEKLSLERLRKLTHVWKNYGQGILGFQNLQQVFVSRCDKLKTLFPATLAKNLKKLAKLEIKTCRSLQEIVEKEEEEEEPAQVTVVFPSLTSLDLYNLKMLTYFYPETFTLECHALRHISVLECPMLKLFQTAHPKGEVKGESSNSQPLFSDLKLFLSRLFFLYKAISNLEKLELDWKHISVLMSSSGELTEDLKYLNDLFLYFDNNNSNGEGTMPYEILEKAPNIESMLISYCKDPEIFVTQNHERLWHVKNLTLYRVYEIEYIGSENSSWLNTLHKLNVFHCSALITLVHSAVTFSYLRELYVSGCDGLEYLFTSSEAKKLMHLEEITIKECGLMKEIIRHDETTSKGIKLEWLDRIVLHDLFHLRCFYSGNDNLQLPSLLQVDILGCPNMEKFSQGPIHVESFRGILASEDSNDDLVFHDNLQDSVKMLFLQQDRLFLGSSQMLQEIWRKSEPVQEGCFDKLTSLNVEDYDEFSSDAILPSHLLPFLSSLEELEVKECNTVKAIFDRTKMINMGPSTVSFFNLTKLIVERCGGLQYLFTSSTAERLPNLKEMHIVNCKSIKAIMAKEGDENEEEIKLEKLEILDLHSLPEIGSFYSGSSTLNFPSLKEVRITECHNMKYLFTSSTAERLPKLREMHVHDCKSIKEIVVKVGDELDQDLVKFEKLEILILRSLPELGCFYSGSWTLNFPSMKHVYLTQCYRMKYLFIFSTATTLPVLNKMHVSGCESIKEIVAKEVYAMNGEQVEILTLSSFPEHGNFYSWGSTLNFPSLKHVMFTACNNIKGFDDGVTIADEFEAAIDGYWERYIYYIIDNDRFP